MGIRKIMRWLLAKILANTPLKNALRGFFIRFPRLDFWLRYRFLPFLTLSASQRDNKPHAQQIIPEPDPTHSFYFQHRDGHYFELVFHTAALADQRGIGRVSKALFNEFEKRSIQAPHKAMSLPKVHFYPTIHWCPTVLPRPCCILIHDVIPLLYDSHFNAVAEHWRKDLQPIAQQADQVLTISYASAGDIAEQLNLSPERIHVVYNGIQALPQAKAEITLPSDHLNKPYVVFIGSSDYHKNLQVVIRALQHLQDTSIQLCLIGHNEDVMNLAKRYEVQDQLVLLGRLDDQTAANVMSRALALVFPSLYEGFGLPPFEAALLGTPSICSQRPAMDELLKDACLFCPPDDPKAWASAIRRYWQDAELRQHYASKAQKIAQQLTWEQSAQASLAVLATMAGQASPISESKTPQAEQTEAKAA
ncbi:MAG TPA: glycosyltransferase family 1 protein [Thiothrix sp.]|nr:glycosyltransferase family 1 protein [Thiothrix sp.]